MRLNPDASSRATQLFASYRNHKNLTLNQVLDIAQHRSTVPTLDRLLKGKGRWPHNVVTALVEHISREMRVAEPTIWEFIRGGDEHPLAVRGLTGGRPWHADPRTTESLLDLWWSRQYRANASLKYFCRVLPPHFMTQPILRSFSRTRAESLGMPAYEAMNAFWSLYESRVAEADVEAPGCELFMTVSDWLSHARCTPPFDSCDPDDMADCLETLLMVHARQDNFYFHLIDDSHPYPCQEWLNEFDLIMVDLCTYSIRCHRGTLSYVGYDINGTDSECYTTMLDSSALLDLSLCLTFPGKHRVLNGQESVRFSLRTLPSCSWFLNRCRKPTSVPM